MSPKPTECSPACSSKRFHPLDAPSAASHYPADSIAEIARLDAARLNREMRTIARVVVHPIFRSVGLAVQLVRHLLDRAETPYVEALAAMGRVHPFFSRAGMTAFDRPALPDAVRVLAAMDRESVRPIDLVDPERLTLSPFLLGEFRRFARKGGTDTEITAIVRQRIVIAARLLFVVASKVSVTLRRRQTWWVTFQVSSFENWHLPTTRNLKPETRNFYGEAS